MTDTTIADISREKVVLDNSEWFEGQDGGGSFKAHVGSIRGVGVVSVTTTAESQDVGPYPQVIVVTTSGSGTGDDLLNIVSPGLDDNGVNVDFIGQAIIVEMTAQTDPSDKVHVTIDGSDASLPVLSWHQPFNGTISMNTINIDYPGAFICFRWLGATWGIDLSSSFGNFNNSWDPNQDLVVQPPGLGSNIWMQSGDSPEDGSHSPGSVGLQAGNAHGLRGGGNVYLTAGQGDGTPSPGDGFASGGSVSIVAGTAGGEGNSSGNVYITAGVNSDGATSGNIYLGSNNPLPTADPHSLGALWNNLGILTISAG